MEENFWINFNFTWNFLTWKLHIVDELTTSSQCLVEIFNLLSCNNRKTNNSHSWEPGTFKMFFFSYIKEVGNAYYFSLNLDADYL